MMIQVFIYLQFPAFMYIINQSKYFYVLA